MCALRISRARAGEIRAFTEPDANLARFDDGQNNCLAIFPFLLFLKVSSLEKTFQNFSRLFHCSVINVPLLIFVISSPEQLWYHIMSFAVCQELFSTFSFFFFAAWPEVFSNFFVKAFVLRRFLNSEVYNTIVLFVCQQLFSFFSIFLILLFVLPSPQAARRSL